MSAQFLYQVGTTLYGEGEHWIARLAEDLGVNERTMRRWLGNESAIPEQVWDELINIAIGRAREIANLVPKMEQAKSR